MASYRSRIHATPVKAVKNGRRKHLEHVNFAAPAELAAIERVEREVIGGPMDPALRAFFLEMNGVQLAFWDVDQQVDESGEIVPVVPGPSRGTSRATRSWPLWKKIEGNQTPRRGRVSCAFRISTRCSGTDWERIHG